MDALLFVLIALQTCLLTPPFLATYAAPNRLWLLGAVVFIGPFLLFKSLSTVQKSCDGDMAAFAMPESADFWLTAFLALLLGGLLRAATLALGGVFGRLSVRIGLMLATLPIFALYSFQILRFIETSVGLCAAIM